MAVELYASVKSFLVNTGQVTKADADAKGTDVFADLPVMDAVAAYSMNEAAKKRADLEVQKAALKVTTGEMTKNNASIENWRERAEIAASMTWPTDQSTIDTLIGLLDKDTAPPELPTDPPTEQKATDLEIKNSRDRNKAIRDLLDTVAKSTTKSDFPENRKLAQSFSAWLAKHGVNAAQSDDTISFDGTTYFDKTKFTTAFTPPTMPAFVVLPDGGTKYWFGKENSADPVVFEWAEEASDRGSWNYQDLANDGVPVGKIGGTQHGHQKIDVSLWPAGQHDILRGRIYKNGDHFFFVAEGNLAIEAKYNYSSPAFFPNPLGTDIDPDTSKQRIIWSDGTKYYEVDSSKVTKTWLDSTGSATILSGIAQGTPHLGFTGTGGPLKEITPKDSYISNPHPDQRGIWAAQFTSQVDKLNANNNLWGAQAASQQVRMQDAVSVYGTYMNAITSVIQKRDKAYQSLTSR